MIKDDVNDVYRKHFHGCRPIYLNDLHFLLNDYVSIDIGISPKIMSFLVNKKIRSLKLNWVLFWVLKMLLPFFKIIRSVQQVLKDMQKGNWDAIWNKIQIRKWYLRKKARISYDIALGLRKLSNGAKRSTSS